MPDWIVVHPRDPLFGVWLLCVSLAITCGVLVIGYVLMQAPSRIRVWRRKRKPLPAPDDPRNRNVVSLRDWKNRETAAKRLRTAA